METNVRHLGVPAGLLTSPWWKQCNQLSDGSMICTRREGHTGRHAAAGVEFILAVWGAPLDPAAIMADHTRVEGEPFCTSDDHEGAPVYWPCETYRLAADLAALYADAQERSAEAWDEGVATALDHAIRNDDGITLRLELPNPYRAALAGEGA